MKSTQVAIAVGVFAVAVALGAVAGWAVTRRTNDSATEVAACKDRIFGHISSLTRADGHFELRFDPAWFTSGVTANVAAAEDGVVEPGEPMPNDHYRIDEGHRLLTYLVPSSTPVSVLTRNGDAARFGATPITVSELAQLVRGERPVELFEGLDTGVWLQVDGDTVCSLDQQYVP